MSAPGPYRQRVDDALKAMQTAASAAEVERVWVRTPLLRAELERDAPTLLVELQAGYRARRGDFEVAE